MIIFCPKCGQKCEIEDQYAGAAVACPTCNEEFLAEPPRIVARAVPTAPNIPSEGRKVDRVSYILLGIFFGNFGVHNFYAGETGHGIAKLVIFVLGWLFLALGNGVEEGELGAFACWGSSSIWTLVEICLSPPTNTIKQNIPKKRNGCLFSLMIFLWVVFFFSIARYIYSEYLS